MVEEFAVVGFVGWEFWVVCGRWLENLTDKDRFAPRTFEHADDPEEDIVLQDMFVQCVIV